MASTELVFRTGKLADVIRRVVDAARLYNGSAARRRRRKFSRRPGAPLDADILRDIGACREYQDYSASAAVSARSNGRLHRIAEAARSASPR